MELREYLSISGISAGEFAELIGTSIHAVRKYIAGERVPRPNIQARIRKATKGAIDGNSWLPALDTKTGRHHNRTG